MAEMEYLATNDTPLEETTNGGLLRASTGEEERE